MAASMALRLCVSLWVIHDIASLFVDSKTEMVEGTVA